MHHFAEITVNSKGLILLHQVPIKILGQTANIHKHTHTSLLINWPSSDGHNGLD